MPPERSTRPRQEPVSCDSCRKKKLKCNRVSPCSNCQARSIQCVFQGRHTTTAAQLPKEPTDLQAENVAIRARLEKLERAVYGGHSVSAAASTSCADSTHGATQRSRQLGLTSPATPASSPEAEYIKVYSADSRWLESVGTRGTTRLPHLHGEPCVRIADMQTIVANISSIGRPAQTLLPRLEETTELFRSWVEHVDALQHVIYVPTVSAMIAHLYASLERSEAVPCTHVALVLSIMASIAGYWGLGQAPQTLFFSPSEALPVALHLLRSTLDVLDHARRTEPPDLETVQTCILVSFLLYHIEGFSPKARNVIATALASAKDIGLHLTDGVHNRRAEGTQEQIIDTEMRRRLWWHLASTDWSMALFGGPYEGTYFVQAKHMQVKKPRNVTDEDLATRGPNFSRPLSETTSSSYYLRRIELGEVCRDVADMTWELLAVRDPEQVDYEQVVALDRKFAGLLEDTPDVHHLLDQCSDVSNPVVGTSHSQLAKQRAFTYLTVQARRTKLHLPFLLRAERDERYSFSRNTCLSSARSVLALRRLLPNDQSHLGGPMRLIGVLHHFFCALVVLVMDVCVNNASGDEEQRKAEVQDAFSIFEDAQERCGIATTFLESVMAILRKHKVRLRQRPAGMDGCNSCAMPDASKVGNATYDSYTDALQSETGGLNDINFDELWQGYTDFGATADPQNWDALFSDLNTAASGAV